MNAYTQKGVSDIVGDKGEMGDILIKYCVQYKIYIFNNLLSAG